jgi:hypothetical protein
LPCFAISLYIFSGANPITNGASKPDANGPDGIATSSSRF